jgi:hydrogenase-4 component E
MRRRGRSILNRKNIVAILTLAIKSMLIPYIFIYIIREIKVKREIALYVGISPSLIIGGILVVISYYLIRSISVITELSSFALSASMSLVSIGLFIMISRKKAIMQMLGILIMENGLFLGAISLTNGMPLLVELGIFFDVLIGVLIMGIIIFRINKTFETIDTDMLKTLIG